MFTTSDKAVLVVSGVLAVAGLLICRKALKELNEIQQRGKEWRKIQAKLRDIAETLESKEA
jgi:hypothetical protein